MMKAATALAVALSTSVAMCADQAMAYTPAKVERIIDGDTIRTSAGTVRVLAIDTPEVYFGAECGGHEASAAMGRLLPIGAHVKLIRDSSQDNRDRYGRLLRYIHIKRRGTDDVGRKLINLGWAEVYRQYPTRRTRAYIYVEAVAKQRHRGIWGQCA